MLANIFNPVQLVIIGAILLILFGPQKLPELAGQLGRALRELRRSTQEITNSFSLDDNHTTYDPPRYDDYQADRADKMRQDTYGASQGDSANAYGGGSYSSGSNYSGSGYGGQASATEAPRGDFAAAAFAEDGDYAAPPAPAAPKPSAPAGTVPRADTTSGAA